MDAPSYPSGHNERNMDYPSTTQALFALIVMVIVLLFILVYCCWGTMTCGQTENLDQSIHGTSRHNMDTQGTPRSSRTFVIVPFNDMIYVGDEETMYQIPIDDEKPPPYSNLPTISPPAYSRGIGNNNSTRSLTDLPPTYEEYLKAFKSPNNQQINTQSTERDHSELTNAPVGENNQIQEAEDAEVIRTETTQDIQGAHNISIHDNREGNSETNIQESLQSEVDETHQIQERNRSESGSGNPSSNDNVNEGSRDT